MTEGPGWMSRMTMMSSLSFNTRLDNTGRWPRLRDAKGAWCHLAFQFTFRAQ
jgi:hypothetical protein